MRRPNTKTIHKVVDWLNEQGIFLYGQHMNVETGEENPGCRDYSADDALARYNHIKNDTLFREDD